LNPDSKGLKGSIQERMADSEMGRTVSRLDDGATQTTFFSADDDTAEAAGYAMA
jgi:hypothetical protein